MDYNPNCPTYNIYVGDELHMIRCKEDFVALVGDKLGYEAKAAMLDLFMAIPDDCPGECDHTYRIQEHYQRGINDAVEALELYGKAKKKSSNTLERIIKHLKGL